MQINRLFEMVYILLGRKTVTAKELSERFDVSVRTIYRDVDTLSSSGIPIYMSKGKGGGIRLLDNFVLNKSILSESEQNEILSALHGLGATNYPDIDAVLAKMSAVFNKNSQNWIEVDFSDWSGNQEKFSFIKTGILDKKIISFEYYSTYGEKTSRKVEPLQLWFKEKAWYLKAFCIEKQSIRIFKLARMKNVQMTDITFEGISSDELQENHSDLQYKNMVTLILKVDSSQAYRVYDEFEENQVIKNDDDSFSITVSYPEDEWVYGHILSYGCFIEVLEPPHIRKIIKSRLQKTLKKYS